MVVTFLHWWIKKGSLAEWGILLFGFGLVGIVGVCLFLLIPRFLIVVLSVVVVVVVLSLKPLVLGTKGLFFLWFS